QRGALSVPPDALGRARELFDAASADEAKTAAGMAEVFGTTGVLVDPHTAVGIRVGRQCRLDPKTPLVCLATAHPAKFPDAVQQATGIAPALPARLEDLHERAERFDVLPNDLGALKAHIEQRSMAAA